MGLPVYRPVKMGARFSTNVFYLPVVLGAAGLDLLRGLLVRVLGQIGFPFGG
jgi:hypothetical protein